MAYLIRETTWYINVCYEYTDYKVNPMRNSILFVLVVASLESGCGAKLPSMKPFKMDIQQGNVVTSKMLMQLRPGMTRSQVRYIMGTPLIVDSFRDNRWDYFYEMREQGQVVEKRRVILDFDKDSLVAVRGDVIPSAENPEIKTIAEAPAKKTVEQKADQKNESWTDKLKFWQGDDAAKPATPAQTDGANAVVPAGTTDKVEPVASANNQPEAVQVTPAATQALPAAVAEEEVVPYIPEGEYKASPSPQEMVQANPAEANTPSVAASAQAVNEKTMAAQIADTVEPPPVFEQDAVAPTVAEQVAEVPPPQAAAPVAATSRATTTNVPAASVPVVTVAAATAPVAAAETTAKSKNSKKSPAAKAQSKPVAATPVTKPVSPPATVNMAEDDEVIPYIPEGEYQAPVIPTEQEMINGNMPEANLPATDAQAHQVTEKGVAPKAEAASEPAPTFIAEQLPEPEPEPELPPPPPPVAKPVVKETLAKESVVQAPATPEPAIAAAPIAAADTLAESQAAMPVAPALPAETERAKPVVPAAASVTNTAAESPALSTDAEINQAVANWAQAWRSRNIKTYLAAYAPDFVPEALPSKAAWEAQRKQRLSPSQGPITLVLNNIQVQRDGSVATVQFEQKYAAKAYKDALNKTLEMRYEPMQKRWLITRERVASIPAAAAVEAMPKVELTASPVAAPQVEGETQALAATPEVSVEAAVDAWAQAWRNKNVNTYLAAYSPEFVPEGLPSRSAWEAQRKKRLSPQQGKITLELGELSVAREGDTAVVIFSQKYASKAYRDEMVKRLQLKLDSASKRWLIVRETVASAADVPAAKQQVNAPEGSAEQPDGAAEPIGF
jgi:outer membrane protein assembly factor BamE (lipoprotein component of BamABCDE complex)/ketosteroid isomerase-like protein